MQTILQRYHRLLFYGVWLFLGLVQSGLTELQDDEAYYWLYGRYLDWGYFDHPPMIGLLINLGNSILPGELGVRFFPLLLNLLSLLIIERLTEKKNPFIFYSIALSIAVLQVSGFIAVPDIPLIFFTALFFLLYRRFLIRSSLLNTLLLGLGIALLMYSKYHAVLIVLFVLLSNIRLLSKYQIYLAGLFSLVLFAPHLYWQYENNWVSFRYHLFESNVSNYKFSFTTEYIIGQLLLPGPVAGFILLPAAILCKVRTQTERGLRYTLIGIYIFFLLSSFRGRVEGNWTSPALVPLMILSHQFLVTNINWRRMLVRTLPFTLILVLFARVVMIADIVPVKDIRKRYHAWKEWPAAMRERTHALPVVISNSYQRAAKYWFYTGQMSYSQNWYRERRNSFNFWPVEDSMLGKPVFFLDKYALARFPDSLQTPIGWIGFKYDSSFASFAKIRIQTPGSITGKQGAPVSFNCKMIIPDHYRRFIMSRTNLADTTMLGIFNDKGWEKDIPVPVSLQQACRDNNFTMTIPPGLLRGKYYVRFTIKNGYYNSTHNSDKIRLLIE